MKAIGIRELKAHLSRYVREVAAGEIVLVTDRGRVVAELRAPGETPTRETALERRLRAAVATLPLRVGESRDADVYRASPVESPEGTARGLLDAERAER